MRSLTWCLSRGPQGTSSIALSRQDHAARVRRACRRRRVAAGLRRAAPRRRERVAGHGEGGEPLLAVRDVEGSGGCAHRTGVAAATPSLLDPVGTGSVADRTTFRQHVRSAIAQGQLTVRSWPRRWAAAAFTGTWAPSSSTPTTLCSNRCPGWKIWAWGRPGRDPWVMAPGSSDACVVPPLSSRRSKWGSDWTVRSRSLSGSTEPPHVWSRCAGWSR